MTLLKKAVFFGVIFILAGGVFVVNAVEKTQDSGDKDVYGRICQEIADDHPGYMCEEASLEMYERLKDAGTSSNVIRGWKNGEPHTWVEIVIPYETMGCHEPVNFSEYKYAETLRWWKE